MLGRDDSCIGFFVAALGVAFLDLKSFSTSNLYLLLVFAKVMLDTKQTYGGAGSSSSLS